MTTHKLVTEQDRMRILGYITGIDLAKPRKVLIEDEDRSD